MTINEMNLTIGDRSKLKKYEKYLETAFYHSYVTGMTMAEKIDIESVYSKYFTEKLSIGCSACIMKMLKCLGNLYFNKKGERN